MIIQGDELSTGVFFPEYARTFRVYAGPLVFVWTAYFMVETLVWWGVDRYSEVVLWSEQPLLMQLVKIPFLIFSVLLQAPCYAWLLFRMEQLNAASSGQAIRFGLSRVMALAANQIGATFATALGFLMLIVPGVLMALGFTLAEPLVVGERQGPVQALRTSWRRTMGHKGAIFVLLLPFGIAQFLMTKLQDVVPVWVKGPEAADLRIGSLSEELLVATIQAGIGALSTTMILVCTCQLYLALLPRTDPTEALVKVFE